VDILEIHLPRDSLKCVHHQLTYVIHSGDSHDRMLDPNDTIHYQHKLSSTHVNQCPSYPL